MIRDSLSTAPENQVEPTHTAAEVWPEPGAARVRLAGAPLRARPRVRDAGARVLRRGAGAGGAGAGSAGKRGAHEGQRTDGGGGRW